MSTILGNPITLGGGGAKLNIDFGTTPPSDTSKLWVPLSQKPSSISLQTGVDVGDFSLQTIPVVDTSGNPYAVPGMSGVADDGQGGWYFFGNQTGNSTRILGTKYVWHMTKDGVITGLGDKLLYQTCFPVCVRVGSSIYVFGGHSGTISGSVSNINIIGNPLIQKFDINTETTTVVYDTSTSTTTNSYGGPWRYAKGIANGGKIILAGGNNAKTDKLTNNGGVNLVRIFDIETNSLTATAFGGNPGQIYVSGISDEKIASSNSGETNGWLYTASTKTFKSAIPYYAGHAYYLANANSIPMNYQGNSFTLSTDGKVYKYLPDVNQFETNPTATITATMPSYNSPRGFNDANAFWGSGTNFYNLAMKTPLANNSMIIVLDIQGLVWKALNTKDTQASVYPIKVLLGDVTGYAEAKDAYLYDSSTSKWTKLDGSSTYQDMLNALNIMGVT